MFTIIGLIMITIGILGLLKLLAISLSVSVIVIVIGVLLVVFGGGMPSWGSWRRPPPPPPPNP